MDRKKRPAGARGLDKYFGAAHTEIKMQLSGNRSRSRRRSHGGRGGPQSCAATLLDLRRGDAAILDHIDLPHDDARRLMELGFLPGTRVTAGFSAPGGDPRIFQVDGSEIALRLETARRLSVRLERGPGKA